MRQPHPPVLPDPGAGTQQRHAGRARPAEDRLQLRPDPFRLLFSASPWRAAGFLISYLIIAPVLFAVALTVSVGTAALAVTVALVPLLIAAAAVIRGCAEVQRALLRQVVSGPVRGRYPAADGRGLWRLARARWTSGATWRDVACLAGLFVPFFALDALVLAIWLGLLAGTTLPLWFRHAYDVCLGNCTTGHTQGIMIGHFPSGPHALGARGFYVDTVSSALVVAAICAAAFLLFNYILVIATRIQGRVLRAVLRTPADPLAPVRHVLSKPGPLGPLVREPYSESGPPGG